MDSTIQASGGAIVLTTEAIDIRATIGRVNGYHHITLGSFTYTETVAFRAPVPGGQFKIDGTIRLGSSLVDGAIAEILFLGWDN